MTRSLDAKQMTAAMRHVRSGSRIADTWAIRDVLLEQVSRFPRMPMDLFQRAVDEYGPIAERRLWRSLAWLEARGKIRRIGTKHLPDGYVRTSDGWTETAADAQARERIDLAADGLCYGCRARTRRRCRYCVACRKLQQNAAEAKRRARRKAVREALLSAVTAEPQSTAVLTARLGEQWSDAAIREALERMRRAGAIAGNSKRWAAA